MAEILHATKIRNGFGWCLVLSCGHWYKYTGRAALMPIVGEFPCPACAPPVPNGTCESRGEHIWGRDAKCVFCETHRPVERHTLPAPGVNPTGAGNWFEVPTEADMPVADTVPGKRCYVQKSGTTYIAVTSDRNRTLWYVDSTRAPFEK